MYLNIFTYLLFFDVLLFTQQIGLIRMRPFYYGPVAAAQPAYLLNWMMAGVGFFTMDTGGFVGGTLRHNVIRNCGLISLMFLCPRAQVIASRCC